MKKSIIFCVGSPKIKNSTSESICNYLIELLKRRNLDVEKLHIYSLVETKFGQDKLFSAVDNSDIIIFSCPLYVDAPPYPVLKAMELIAEHKRNSKSVKRQKILAISNCGFPRAEQNNVALSIYHNFAKEANFDWMGSLAFSMGVALNGVSMKALGTIYPNIRKAFKITAEAIVNKEFLPENATKLAGKPFIPIGLYIWIGNTFFWRFIGIRNGTWNLSGAPYERGLK